jgi:transcriptional regulator with GAF, ATPase, and Fis domain
MQRKNSPLPAGSAAELEVALLQLTTEDLRYPVVIRAREYFQKKVLALHAGQNVTCTAVTAVKNRLQTNMGKENVPQHIQDHVNLIIAQCVHHIKGLSITGETLRGPSAEDALPPYRNDTALGEKVAIDIHAGENSKPIPLQLVHQSAAMEALLAKAEKIAPKQLPVVIYGETGTGKELIARLMHQMGGERHLRTFSAINCAALPETLIESELFGHKKGAFTGATANKEGLFESVGEGTLFLDEIGELPLSLQSKLLRIFDTGEFSKIGDPSNTLTSRARIVTATNRNLEEEVEMGAFRRDLYFRLGFPITTPALRERADLETVAAHVTNAIQEGYTLDAKCMELLRQHSFPGNIRELSLAIQCAIAVSDTKVLTWEDVSPYLSNLGEAA